MSQNFTYVNNELSCLHFIVLSGISVYNRAYVFYVWNLIAYSNARILQLFVKVFPIIITIELFALTKYL